jgi:Fe-S-cluster containining protein
VLEGAEIYLHLKKTRRWTKSFQENLVKAADAVTGLAYQIWLYSETACPFLDVKGLCSVYAVRPLTCRTAASRGNPDECHPQELVQAHKIVQRVSELNEFSLAERAILRLFNADYHTMPIPTAVLVAQRICDGEYLLGQAGSAVLAEHIGRF